MSTPDLSAKLPPPHDEEQAQLRSDILDELQDHLSCAADRERRRLQLSDQPADPASVWTAVIERFGDPSALARRLWFDAMKGRLMTRRVLIGMVGLLTVLVGVLVWRSFFYVPQPFIDERAMAAMIERVRKEVATTPAVTSQDLVPVKYRLVNESSDRSSVSGMKVKIREISAGKFQNVDIVEETNAEGLADFGYLASGVYELMIDSPPFSLSEKLAIRPGRPIDSQVVIPGASRTRRLNFQYSEPDWKAWGWEDGPSPGGDFALYIDWHSDGSVPLGAHSWQGYARSGSALLRSDGLYRIGEYPRKYGTPEKRWCLLQDKIEDVMVPTDSVLVTAHWWYSPEGEEKKDPKCHKMFRAYSPVAELGWKPPLQVALANAKKYTESFPIEFRLEPRLETQMIQIPVNHPYTYSDE